ALSADTDRILFGHHDDRRGWVIDSTQPMVFNAATNYTARASLRGTSVAVYINENLITTYSFNSPLVDGRFGLIAGAGGATWHDLTVRTDDPAVHDTVISVAAAPAPASVPVVSANLATTTQSTSTTATRPIAVSRPSTRPPARSS